VDNHPSIDPIPFSRHLTSLSTAEFSIQQSSRVLAITHIDKDLDKEVADRDSQEDQPMNQENVVFPEAPDATESKEETDDYYPE